MKQTQRCKFKEFI